MEKSINKAVRGVVCLALAAVSMVGATAANAIETNTQIAYVFDENENTKDSFKDLLTQQGYEFRGVRLDRVPQFDFSGIDVILVAADTGDSYWGFHSSEAAESLNSLQKPILALGVGGSILLDEVAPAFGYGGSMEIKSESVQVASPNDRVWAQPSMVAGGGADVVNLYKDVTAQQAIWSGRAADSVLPVAQSLNDEPYYPLATGKAEDGQKVFLWGFYGNARKMTGAGEKLFVNSIERIAP